MDCPQCGKEVRGHFCTNCGTRVDQASSPPDQPGSSDAEATSYIRQEDLARMATESKWETSAAPPSPSGPYAHDPGASRWGSNDAGWRAGFGEASVATGPTAVMQPMSLGQIISGTFDILRARLPQFLGVAAVYGAVMFVAGIIFSIIAGSAVTSGDLGASILAVIIGGLILVAVAIVAGSVAGAAYINISHGDENTQTGNLVADTQAIIQRALDDAPRLFLALLLVVGIYVAGLVITTILAQILGPLGGIIRLAWFIAAIWYEVTFIMTAQAAVIDDQSPVNAMTESRALVTGYWWRTFGYSLVGAVMLIPAYIVAAIVIAILGAILSSIPILDGIVVALVGAAVFSAIYAFFITYLTLMFYDLKARKAGMTQQATAPSY